MKRNEQMELVKPVPEFLRKPRVHHESHTEVDLALVFCGCAFVYCTGVIILILMVSPI